MYHPLNKITCPPLNKLNELAKLTLEFSLIQNMALPEDQIGERFSQHFAASGYPAAGDWLWKKDVLIRPHVLALIVLPINEKQDIFAVYLQNQAFDERFIDGTFASIPMPPVSQTAYDSAAELAKNFYKILGDGVPGDKINEPEKLDRQTVLRAYLDAQRQLPLKVCPGCDGKPPSIADGKIQEDLDHFFPKSKYPFLSIHPLNLTPFCKDCNQTYKSSKDAILDTDATVEDVHALCDIYHPYQCPARDDLALQIKSDPEDHLSFSFVSQSNTAQSQARLHSLQYTLDLESRWTGDLQEERVEERLNFILLVGSQKERDEDNFHPDPEWLDQQLRTAIDSMKRLRGRDYQFVLALSYVEWVKSSPKAKNIWLERVKGFLTLPVVP